MPPPPVLPRGTRIATPLASSLAAALVSLLAFTAPRSLAATGPAAPATAAVDSTLPIEAREGPEPERHPPATPDPDARLTGDWAGARPLLARAGLRVVAASTAEVAFAPGALAGLHLADVAMELDLPEWGLRVVAQLYGKSGREALRGFEVWHGLSGADAADFVGAGEAWVEVDVGGGIRARAGRLDGNSEFLAAEPAGEFGNPSFALSPALDHVPSYPEPAAGASVFAKPAGGPELGAAILSRGADGYAVLAQARSSRGARPGVPRWTAGVVASGGPRSGAAVDGAYLMLEGSGEGIAPFVSIAGSVGAPTTASRHVALGVTAPLSIPGGTRFGVAGSWLRPADASAAGDGTDVVADVVADGVAAGRGARVDEALIESFVRLEAAGWLALQPDLQVALPLVPGGRPRWAFLLRIELAY